MKPSAKFCASAREFGGDALLSADPHGKGTLCFTTRISAENIPLQKYIAWSKTFHGAEAEDAVHHVENLGRYYRKRRNRSRFLFGHLRADGGTAKDFAR